MKIILTAFTVIVILFFILSYYILVDIYRLLRLFQALRKAICIKPLKKNKDLEEKTHEEAAKELNAELKKWQEGFTSRPVRIHTPSPKISDAEQRMDKDQYNHALEAKAEKKYRSMDNKYDVKLKEREEKIQQLIQKTDHIITPLRHELLKYPEADKTLLIADWPELKRTISVQEFRNQDMREKINRTITAIRTIKRHLKRERIKSLINEVKWVLDWLKFRKI